MTGRRHLLGSSGTASLSLEPRGQMSMSVSLGHQERGPEGEEFVTSSRASREMAERGKVLEDEVSIGW